MKVTNLFSQIFLTSAFLIFLSDGIKADEPTIETDTDFVETSLNTEPSITVYPTFRHDARPVNIDGYGIYSTFGISKEIVKVDDNGSVSFSPWSCREDYCLLFCLYWHVLRRQFDQIIDLSQADGIEVTINVEKPLKVNVKRDGKCRTHLRVVLCDRDKTLTGRRNNNFDNQWIFDLPKSVLYEKHSVTLRVPFSKLRKPSQDEKGSRISSLRRFRPTYTTAYEIAIIGISWNDFGITSVITYKDKK